MYFDKSWNKICNKHLGLYRYGRNNDWPCRQRLKTGSTKTYVWCSTNWATCTMYLQLSVSWVSDPLDSPGEEWIRNPWLGGNELFGGGDWTSVTVTFPKVKTTEENRKNINLPGHISTNHRWGFLSCGQESRSGGSPVSLHPIP